MTIKSGLSTPIAEIPTPDFAVPYAAPKQVKTMAEVQPMAPKKGYTRSVSHTAWLHGRRCKSGRITAGIIVFAATTGRD